jgi:azurin
MKKYILLPMLAGSVILAGCGKKDDSAAATTAAPASAPSAASADANAVASFDLNANDSMKFNLTRLEVKAGQDVKVTMTNMGNLPKAAMGHNWILLKKGVDPKAFVDAAVSAAATDYIPASHEGDIIAHTKLLGPKQSEEVSFKAPTEPGEYHYLCSFPAHFLSGMTGVLVVK